MINRIISISFLAFIGITSVFFFIIALFIRIVTAPFDKRLVALHLFSSLWASIYLWLMPACSMTITGRKKIRRNATYIVVSNHQSQLDILVAFRLFFPFKWVSKAEVFKIPFIGWNMVMNRYIKLTRGNSESVKQMMKECEHNLEQGSSVYLFPEGTRSATGILKEFKSGGFTLARKMQLPLLPIAINGTRKALPRHSVHFHGKHHFRIKVLDEIPYETFAHLTPDETAHMVREIIAGHIDEHAELGSN